MFEHIKAAPADPILGLGEAFKSETRENKINLGIGVYKDAQGTTPIMRAVKEAEKRLFDNEKTKNYLTIDGIADYNERTKELLFGKDSEVIKANRAQVHYALRQNSSNAKPKHKMYGLVRQHGQTTMQFSMR